MSNFLLNNTFTNTIYYYVFISIFLTFYISEVFIFIKTKKNSIGKIKEDKGSFFIIIGAVWFIVLVNFYWLIFRYLLPSYFEFIGMSIIILGMIVRIHSVISLNASFTISVSIGNNQKIIKDGLYKFIRHPAYLGSIISLLGISIAIRNIFNISLTILVIIIMYTYRIKIEEKALIKNFGNEYMEYKSSTKAIIPKIL